MTPEEINTLVVNMICYACDIDEEKVHIGWQSKIWEPDYGKKMFYVGAVNRKEAEQIRSIVGGEIQEGDINYCQVVFPLGNIFQ